MFHDPTLHRFDRVAEFDVRSVTDRQTPRRQLRRATVIRAVAHNNMYCMLFQNYGIFALVWRDINLHLIFSV